MFEFMHFMHSCGDETESSCSSSCSSSQSSSSLAMNEENTEEPDSILFGYLKRKIQTYLFH